MPREYIAFLAKLANVPVQVGRTGHVESGEVSADEPVTDGVKCLVNVDGPAATEPQRQVLEELVRRQIR